MQLLEHFNELSLHPKNAKELKGLILQLAVEGKLTSKWRELNPNVESGKELLAHINAEKVQLEKEKIIRKEKPLPKISEQEEKFNIPENWIWSRLGTIGNIFNGDSVNKSIKEAKYQGLEHGYPYIATKDVGYSFEPINEDNGVRIPFEEPKFKVAKKGTVLICSEGGSAGKKMGKLAEDCCFGNKLYAIHQYGQIDSTYILCVYGSAYFGTSFSEKMSGIIGGISRSNFIEIVIPIPPREEQKAIVKVVNQLFAEVDQLETLTQERIHLKENFATSALRQLSTGNTASEWTFLKEHFSTFFTEKSNIKKLRESILQLAVQGKLTAQWRAENPSLSPASELLERIKLEKDQLVKEKKIKKEKPLPKISEEEIPYELPEGWVWCRMGSVATHILGKMLDRSKNKGHNMPYLRNANVRWFGFDLSNLKDMRFEENEKDKFSAIKDDVLICEGGYPGRAAIWKSEKPIMFQKALHRVRFIGGNVLPEYFVSYLYLLDSNRSIEMYFTGAGIQHLTGQSLHKMLLPLPPLEEQKVIVEKVNSLMTLCDDLEAAVEMSKTTQEKWMASSLREVFEGEEKLEKV